MVSSARGHTWPGPPTSIPARRSGIDFRKPTRSASFIGNGTPFNARDFSLGLLLIGPRTFYRDRRHKAPELYAPLTGPTLWRFHHGPWVEPRPAYQPIWNDALRVHATLVEEPPFLCIYVWTQDVSEPAALVAAPDWAEIEQRL